MPTIDVHEWPAPGNVRLRPDEVVVVRWHTCAARAAQISYPEVIECLDDRIRIPKDGEGPADATQPLNPRRLGLIGFSAKTISGVRAEISQPVHNPHDHGDDDDGADYSVAKHVCLSFITPPFVPASAVGGWETGTAPTARIRLLSRAASARVQSETRTFVVVSIIPTPRASRRRYKDYTAT
jgi:hypothetical protein